MVDRAGSLLDNLELETLQGKDEGETVKWLNKVNDLFTEFAEINDNDASNKKKFVGELTKKCTRFNSLMRISPAYIGHQPLFKYKNVREAFQNLGKNVAAFPKLVQYAIGKLLKPAKAKPRI
ncbi:MAG: hypothetical protein IJC57_01305 [Clostridia bacterium]|nr:hypothetical protein [Clostridia bacterium]